jgi:arylsulfatase A-like enzyme
LYDEVISVPLLIQDGENTGTYNGLVGLVDIAPTILDYLGIEAPNNFEGQSLRGALAGNDIDRPPVLSEYGEPRKTFGVSCRNSDEKYIYWSDSDDELYDLRTDPEEKQNLINETDPSDNLKQRVESHRKRIINRGDNEEEMMNAEMEERLSALGYK